MANLWLTNEGFGSETELCPIPHLRPEQVPAADVEEAEVPDNPVADGALPRPRGANDQGVSLVPAGQAPGHRYCKRGLGGGVSQQTGQKGLGQHNVLQRKWHVTVV